TDPGAGVIGAAMTHRSHHRDKVPLAELARAFTDPSADAAHAAALSLPSASGRTHEDEAAVVVHAVEPEFACHVGAARSRTPSSRYREPAIARTTRNGRRAAALVRSSSTRIWTHSCEISPS